MKIRTFIKMTILAAVCGITTLSAQPPEMPKPSKEQEWLSKFLGEWEVDSQFHMPGQDPVKGKGTESVKSIGGFWVVSYGTGEMMGNTMTFSMTFGYDAAKKKYVGTMIESMTGKAWSYEGTVNEAGNTLTMETQGPCPMRGGVMTDFQDVVEFKPDGSRLMTSKFKDEKGEWVTVYTGEARKK